MLDSRTFPTKPLLVSRLVQPLVKIVSGGQTGVDRAALDLALELGAPCGGWCPKGRTAEDGAIDLRYPLKETNSSSYPLRTEWNVRDSDGTLILSYGPPSRGTKLTIDIAKRLTKPFFILDLLHGNLDKAGFRAWLNAFNVRELNIAGPRESNGPGKVYNLASKALRELLV